MISPLFKITGEEGKALLFGLLEVNKMQLRANPRWPSMREMIRDGRVKYTEVDPQEHWKTYREIVEEVQKYGKTEGDCEDLATAVSAEDQIRHNVASFPFAYQPKKGLFHVVNAVPSKSSAVFGGNWPRALLAPRVAGYDLQDISAAAGMPTRHVKESMGSLSFRGKSSDRAAQRLGSQEMYGKLGVNLGFSSDQIAHEVSEGVRSGLGLQPGSIAETIATAIHSKMPGASDGEDSGSSDDSDATPDSADPSSDAVADDAADDVMGELFGMHLGKPHGRTLSSAIREVGQGIRSGLGLQRGTVSKAVADAVRSKMPGATGGGGSDEGSQDAGADGGDGSDAADGGADSDAVADQAADETMGELFGMRVTPQNWITSDAWQAAGRAVKALQPQSSTPSDATADASSEQVSEDAAKEAMGEIYGLGGDEVGFTDEAVGLMGEPSSFTSGPARLSVVFHGSEVQGACALLEEEFGLEKAGAYEDEASYGAVTLTPKHFAAKRAGEIPNLAIRALEALTRGNERHGREITSRILAIWAAQERFVPGYEPGLRARRLRHWFESGLSWYAWSQRHPDMVERGEDLVRNDRGQGHGGRASVPAHGHGHSHPSSTRPTHGHSSHSASHSASHGPSHPAHGHPSARPTHPAHPTHGAGRPSSKAPSRHSTSPKPSVSKPSFTTFRPSVATHAPVPAKVAAIRAPAIRSPSIHAPSIPRPGADRGPISAAFHPKPSKSSKPAVTRAPVQAAQTRVQAASSTFSQHATDPMDITFKPQKGFSASASTADDIMFAPQSHLESTYKGLEDDGTPDAFDFSEMQSDLALDEQGAFDFSSIEEGFDLEGALTSDVDPGDSQDLDYFSTEDPTLGLGDD